MFARLTSLLIRLLRDMQETVLEGPFFAKLQCQNASEACFHGGLLEDIALAMGLCKSPMALHTYKARLLEYALLWKKNRTGARGQWPCKSPLQLS